MYSRLFLGGWWAVDVSSFDSPPELGWGGDGGGGCWSVKRERKGEKEEEVSTPLTPDPSAVFSRYFPYHHPKADISKPTFLRPLPQRHILLLPMHFLRGGMLLFSPLSLSSSSSSLVISTDKCILTNPFLRDSEKKRRERQGVLHFSGYPLRRLPPPQSYKFSPT